MRSDLRFRRRRSCAQPAAWVLLLGALFAADVARADLSLRNASDALLACGVDARYTGDDGGALDLVLIGQTPISPGQRVGGSPVWLRVWRPERARFVQLALNCDGTLDGHAIRLHAVVEHDDPFWEIAHPSWSRCVPDPFVDNELEIVRYLRAGADGFALRGVCRTAQGGAPYRALRSVDFEFLP